MSSIKNILSRLRESKYPDLSKGQKFENAGYTWEILDIKGEYILIYSEERKYTPYVVAWRFDISDNSWAQGHYFDNEESAMKYMEKVELDEDSKDYIYVEYTYNGDELSNYLGHVKVNTDNKAEALKAAEIYAMSKHPEDEPRHFTISDDEYTNLDTIDSNGNVLKSIDESEEDEEADKPSIRVDTYINDEDKVTMSKVKNSIASYPIGTYLRYATKGAINAMNQYTYGLYKTGEDSWSPYSSFVGLATEKSYTGEEVLRNMATKGAKTIGVKLPKGELSEAEESDDMVDNPAYLEFVEKCTSNPTWKKIDAICKKNGYKLAPLSYVEISSSGRKRIRLSIVPDGTNKYTPDIYFNHGRFGDDKPVFEIQTWGVGALELGEYTKFVSAVTSAKDMIEEVITIDLYKLYQEKEAE